MKNSLLILFVFVFIGCSTKVPNTWKDRIENAPYQNIKLHVDIKGEGEPLLLLHGFGFSGHSFHHLIKPLSKKYKVYNFDLKGFGNSPKPKDYRYSIYDQAVLIQQYIKEHNLKNITIIGHSYGGSIALSLALINQKNIQKMVLISPAAFKQNLPSLILWMQKPIIGVVGFYMLPNSYGIKESYKYAFFDKEKIPQDTLSVMTKNLEKENAKYIYYNATFDLIPEDIDKVSKRYKEIKIPTLLIWGKNDVVIHKNRGYRLNRYLQNSELKIIKNCGHIPHEEKPDEVIKYLQEFLSL